MMNRRSLLIAAATLTLSQLLAGCGGRRGASLRVRLLENSVPAELLQEFQRLVRRDLQRNLALDFLPREQLSDLYALLQLWQPDQETQPETPSRLPLPFLNRPRRPPAVADLVTLGDYWLQPAIQQGLIQPLNPDEIAGWQQIPPQWQAIVRRDRFGKLDPQGDIWAAPYRWGSAVIVYRVEEFEELGWVPTDWSDLWRPELRRQISLLESPRTVIGLTLKKLGYSINTENLDEVPQLFDELDALQQQVKVYSSDAYLQPLLLGDTWLAVGWSTDVWPVLERDRRIAAVVPESGTILTADTWVRPATASSEADDIDRLALAQRWMSFCWQPETALQLSLLSSAVSPILLTLDRTELPSALRTNPILLPDPDVLADSEFIHPLTDEAIEQYQALWVKMRQTDS